MVGLDASDLRHLLSGVEIGGYRLDDGRGRVAAWLRWRGGQLADAVVQLDLANLAISSATVQRVQAGPLHGLAGLRRVGDDGDDHGAELDSDRRRRSYAMTISTHAKRLRTARRTWDCDFRLTSPARAGFCQPLPLNEM